VTEDLKDRINHRRTCPHPLCETKIPREMFACRSHWNELPAQVRRDIWRSWRAYKVGQVTLDDLTAEHEKAITAWEQGR
jgi:hypothetical protein